METSDDKNIEQLLIKVFADAELKSPSIDFTANVMLQVEQLSKAKTAVYKPLISKLTWILLALGCAGLMCYLVFGNNLTPSNWNVLNPFINYIKLNTQFNLPQFNIPLMYIYGASCFLAIFLIQIPLLKQYFEKRLVV